MIFLADPPPRAKNEVTRSLYKRNQGATEQQRGRNRTDLNGKTTSRSASGMSWNSLMRTLSGAPGSPSGHFTLAQPPPISCRVQPPPISRRTRTLESGVGGGGVPCSGVPQGCMGSPEEGVQTPSLKKRPGWNACVFRKKVESQKTLAVCEPSRQVSFAET